MPSAKSPWPLVAGLAVTCLLAASWAASVQAGGLDAAGPAVGEPRQGDEVRYRLTLGGSVEGDFAFRWNGTGTRVDAWGRDRAVDVASGGFVHPGVPHVIPLETAYAAGTLEVVSHAYRTDVEQAARHPLARSGHLWFLGEEAEREGDFRWYGRFMEPLYCIPRAGWQGVPLDALDGLDVRDACPALALDEDADARFRDEGWDDVDGVPARKVRVDLSGHGMGRDAVLWFADGVPYPILREVTYTLPGGTVHARDALVAYAPGDGPVLARAPPAPAPAPRLDGALGDPGRWGVVSSDPSLFAYPPEAAIRALETDAQLRAYLATHPTARVVAYEMSEHESVGGPGGHREVRWAFTFGDERGEGWRAATGLVTGARVGGWAGLPEVGAPAPVGTPVNHRGAPVATLPLTPDTVPPAVLDLAEAVRRWSAGRGEDAPPFNHVVVEFLPEGADAASVLSVGHHDPPAYREPSASSPALAWDEAFDARAFDPATSAARWDVAMRFGHAFGVDAMPRSGEDWRERPVAKPDVALAGVAYPAVAALTLAALVAYYFAALQALVVRLVAVPLFTRLGKGDVLANPTRAALLAAIRDAPGVHGAELMRRVGCGNGALLYHLEVLRREGLVSRVPEGQAHRYYVAGTLPRAEMARHAFLLSGSHGHVFRLIQERPGLSQRELAARAGLSAPAVHYVVKRLEAENLVRRERQGRTTTVHPRDPAAVGAEVRRA